MIIISKFKYRQQKQSILNPNPVKYTWILDLVILELELSNLTSKFQQLFPCQLSNQTGVVLSPSQQLSASGVSGAADTNELVQLP